MSPSMTRTTGPVKLAVRLSASTPALKSAHTGAANGVKAGAVLRDALAKRMTPDQIAEAQQLAREWKPKGK